MTYQIYNQLYQDPPMNLEVPFLLLFKNTSPETLPKLAVVRRETVPHGFGI